VILVHGGAWKHGDKTDMAPLARRLARDGYVAVAVNYRLTSVARWPAQRVDVLRALRAVRHRAAALGVDTARIGMLGSSAGGHLALDAGTLGDGRRRVRAVVAWSPPVDLAALVRAGAPGCRRGCTTPALAGTTHRDLLGCAPRACPARYADASPVTHVSPDDAPTLVVNSRDELIPLAQLRALDRALTRAGVRHRTLVLPGHAHALRYAHRAWRTSEAWLRRFLGPGVASPAVPQR